MAKGRTYTAASSYVQVEWGDEEGLSDSLLALLKEELTPIAAKMEAAAKANCPVSSREKAAPKTSRPKAVGYDNEGRRSFARVKTPYSKRGYHWLRDYNNTRKRTVTKPYEDRKPGRLRDSIRSTAAARKDKTAFLLFLEAGDKDAYYAPFVEFGTSKMEARPFIRTAFNAYKAQAIAAIERAMVRLGQK